MIKHPQRDDEWLGGLLVDLMDQYFSDVERVNHIRVEFGRRARRRLGSISLDRDDRGVSVIRVNGWFKDPHIPEFLVRSVMVHELCHYAHGFNSGADNTQHRHPHAGGVIRREFAERGLGHLYDQQQKWLKEQWPKFVANKYRPVKSSVWRGGYRRRVSYRLSSK